MHRPLVIVLLLSIGVVSQTPDPTPVDGRISGTVVNEAGKPVPRATVCVSQEASSFVDANRIATQTDAAGRFDFGQRLKHGYYEIFARKDIDGYPDPTSKFYRPLNFSVQNVQLYGEHPAEKITVQLSERAAVLTGRVYDEVTGGALNADVAFSNLQTNSGLGVMAEDGKFRELIPANTDVVVMVQEIDGEAEWSLFRTTVNLRPGQTMHIDVPLYKAAAPAESSQ